MRCARVQQLYDDYACGHLNPATACRVDRHLERCPACREAYESNDELSELLNRCSLVDHPGQPYFDNLTESVMARMSEGAPPVRDADSRAQPRRAPNRTTWIWAGGAMAAALVFAVALNLLVSRPDAPAGNDVAGLTTAALNPPDRPIPANDASNPPVSQWTTLTAIPLAAGASSGDAARNPSFASALNVSSLSNRPGDYPSLLVSPSPAASPFLASPFLTRSEHARGALTKSARPEIREAVEREVDAIEREAAQRDVASSPAADRRPPRLTSQDASEPADDALAMRQKQLFEQAERLRQKGLRSQAVESYFALIEMNPASDLARRACLRMGDLYFDEFGDFKKARSFYKRCLEVSSQDALSAEEKKHAQRQFDELERFAGYDYVPLRVLHNLSHGSWEDVAATMNALSGQPGVKDVMQELHSTLVNRVRSGDAPNDQTMWEILKAMEACVNSIDSPPCKAWLCLTAGDLLWLQYRDPDSTVKAYRGALTLAPHSAPAAMAREKLNALRDVAFNGALR